MRAWYDINRHMVEVWFWILCAIPTLLWWRQSVLWVALMSLYANVKTAQGAHEARMSRKEVQEK